MTQIGGGGGGAESTFFLVTLYNCQKCIPGNFMEQLANNSSASKILGEKEREGRGEVTRRSEMWRKSGSPLFFPFPTPSTFRPIFSILATFVPSRHPYFGR